MRGVVYVYLGKYERVIQDFKRRQPLALTKPLPQDIMSMIRRLLQNYNAKLTPKADLTLSKD